MANVVDKATRAMADLMTPDSKKQQQTAAKGEAIISPRDVAAGPGTPADSAGSVQSGQHKDSKQALRMREPLLDESVHRWGCESFYFLQEGNSSAGCG